MKVFTCTDHDCYWPVGVASLVVAPTEDEARGLLAAALVERQLDPASFTLTEIDLDAPAAHVLIDDDY